ncbi:arginyl-tRNA synthetase [Frankia sp. CcI6]|uniref:arginine--tRNA ligase domain-containing protein n=1 Tax=unclassified Frankia TaxID=2632575 RepID=UPI0003CFE9E9|nr:MULTISPECIES: arginine--tRNA ligase [unclassified Frankia]ETA04402.1 arginyl-tRNA synthetase [Frankia sp. CcI6]KDA44900.1 arginyl-tRNA synthetase [Frankia sp. BMG5.23]KFB06551.1 arginyl-tRNA synthetase [Frankia sp. Allo2]
MLAQVTSTRRRDIEDLRDRVRGSRPAAFPSSRDYPLARLSAIVTQALQEKFARSDLTAEIELISREKFGADVTVKMPMLLKEAGAKEFVRTYIPRAIEALQVEELKKVISEATAKGIYINLTLSDNWLAQAVQGINSLGDRFGENDSAARRTLIIEYSSPNVAKKLHAGHVRSTIIGHVLGNLHQACGALVYRLNHINDFGGFGFMLEGFRRFGDMFPAAMTENDRLLEIYAIRRALERVVASGGGLGGASESDAAVLQRYFPGVDSKDALESAFKGYVEASDARFARLEGGDSEEVELWSKMVDWSLADFRSFYEALDIHIDFTIGESFYFQAGNEVIETALRDGRAFEFTESRLREEIAKIEQAMSAGEITSAVRDRTVEFARKDLGAIVVPLPGNERFVVRRSDGRSIYATRDVGAIKLRRDIFDPSGIYYVVGQEQRVHFARLFQAVEVLGIASRDELDLRHIYFGFYVDEKTGRKLSSRDSVAGVNDLLKMSFEHFWKRSAERGTMTEEELSVAAQQLAVGSLVFNDLKQDMKTTVAMARGDLSPTLTAFEKSGGPYVVYTACRARAILRKWGKPVPSLVDLTHFEVSDQEAQLILRLQELPSKITRATGEDSPAILVRYLLDLAALYNSYYTTSPVLAGEAANEFRLMITRAVQYTLVNGLRLCHVECPPKI